MDKTIYVSGQLGMDPTSGQLVAGGVKNEAKQVKYYFFCTCSHVQNTKN